MTETKRSNNLTIKILVLLAIACFTTRVECKLKAKSKQQKVTNETKETAQLGEYHTFSLKKYEKPE